MLQRGVLTACGQSAQPQQTAQSKNAGSLEVQIDSTILGANNSGIKTQGTSDDVVGAIDVDGKLIKFVNKQILLRVGTDARSLRGMIPHP